MDQEILKYVIETTNELMAAPSCSSEAKESAQKWLDAVGTEQEATETQKYITELEADIIPIDGLISFAGSDAGIQAFGAETAKNIEEHAKVIKSAGAQYCDCPACTAVATILDKKDALLK